MTFICDKCKAEAHEQCRGGTWCDCLHRTKDESSHLHPLRVTSRIPSCHFK